MPSYKISVQYPLARGKVRYVGELVAMTVAPTRAEAEDLAEQIELDFDELPALVDAHAARVTTDTRVHEDWHDNLFVTLDYDSGFDEHIAQCHRSWSSARSRCRARRWCRWKARRWSPTGTTRPTSSSSTPRPRCRTCIRIGLAKCLGIEQGQVRVISPDVGGGFGYKCVLQPEELCVAWLALNLPHARSATSRIGAST